MKRLVSGDDVYEKAKLNEPIYIDEDTLVTPYARDLSRELGVKIECRSKQRDLECKQVSKTTEDKECAPILSEDEIYSLLKEAIDGGYLNPKELDEML